MLSRWIQIAEESLKLGNYSFVFQAMNAFRHPAVDRLTQTWKALGKREIQSLKKLAQLVQAEDNYNRLNSELAKRKLPVLPCFELLVGDLAKVHMRISTTTGEYVNVHKLVEMGNVLNKLVAFQAKRFSIVLNRDISEMIAEALCVSDTELMRQSRFIESPGNPLNVMSVKVERGPAGLPDKTLPAAGKTQKKGLIGSFRRKREKVSVEKHMFFSDSDDTSSESQSEADETGAFGNRRFADDTSGFVN